jgi:predicted AAA+ superfamily ATPase
MTDILKELKNLNSTLQRLADFLLPELDPAVFGRYKAFRAYTKNNNLSIKGIAEPDPIRLQELRGIDQIIRELKKNTEQFLQGLPCNNVLLYGPRGTGKSSAVKAILNAYGNRGLKMIEMPRDTLFHILDVAEIIKDRQENFIIFCDDLTFEEEEKSYRQLKTILEGGLETRPKNMLIYATSNRRHLMPEMAGDNLPTFSEGELQPAETVEEKMSLSDRFGLRFGLPHFDVETYLDIVCNYASLRKISIDYESLRENAMQWSLSHGSYSGRTARQFVDDLEGHMGSGKNKKRRP